MKGVFALTCLSHFCLLEVKQVGSYFEGWNEGKICHITKTGRPVLPVIPHLPFDLEPCLPQGTLIWLPTSPGSQSSVLLCITGINNFGGINCLDI